MFFEINGDNYNYYNADSENIPKQVDIELASPTPNPTVASPKSKITCDLQIWDNFENQYWAMVNYISTDYRVSNVVDQSMQDSRILFCDFLFNRTKAYYTNFEFASNIKKWYWADEQAYKIPRHVAADKKKNVYVAPNKTWDQNHRQTRWRPNLVDLLLDYKTLGHLADYHRDQTLFLYPHWVVPECTDIQQLTSQQIKLNRSIGQIKRTNQWGYSPPHNLYYEDTFISIYGETIEYGTSIAVTEKTYDPLIKGHFILPFSCKGFLAHVVSLGFQLPEFINYDYDQESDDQKRFAMYSQEIRRLLSLDIDIWREHWTANKSLIEHNQSLFFSRPYDQINFTSLIQ